jgi:hypothetical protein
MPAVTKTTKTPKKTRTEVVAENATPNIIFGVTFDLNGTLIPVSAGQISTWKEDGVKLKLPHAVEVGSIADALKYLEGWLGITMPDTTTLPKFIKDVIDGITSMVITVYQAEIEIPKETAKSQEKKYLLEVGGISQTGIPIIPDTKFLMIKGLVVGATNKELPPSPASIQ